MRGKNNSQPVEADEIKKAKTNKAEKINDKVVRIFDDILETDEKIIKASMPYKPKVFMSNLIRPLGLYLIFLVSFILMYLFPSAELTRGDSITFIVCISALFLVIEVLILLITIFYCKNTFYAFSNKRLLTISGLWGSDIKSLDLNNIGNIEIKFSLLDKVLKKNTGTIKITSSIVPMNSPAEVYTLISVLNAKEFCKDIKLKGYCEK